MLKKIISDSGFFAVLSLICALAIDIQQLKSQDSISEEIFSKLEMKYGKEFRKEASRLRDSINKIDNITNRHFYLNKLFNITGQKDEISHIHSLIWKAYSGDPDYAVLFEKAFKIAEKHNHLDYMCLVEYSRGNFYIARKQYDSAMIHILRYQDMTPESEKGEGYRNIINMLGDIYFHAGLYEQAHEVYFNLYKQYEEEDNWNFYRPYVMMNNLGQIALKTGETELAREWFTKSVTTAEKMLQTNYKNNTLAYTRIKLAETALRSDSLAEAELILKEVENYPKQDLFEDVYQEYLFVKAQLLFKQNKTKEALEIAMQLIPGDSIRFDEYRFIPEIYKLLSEILFPQKDYPQALEYRKTYEHIADSLLQQEHLAQSMIILANRNHIITKNELAKSKRRTLNLAIGLGFLLIILFIIMFMYRKLYRSRLELVKKSLAQNDITAVEEENHDISNENKSVDGIDIQQQKQLVKDLKKVMGNDKLFLDPKINIQEVAKVLSSNRTYLSRAINNQLQTTFPNFINEYRIKEAIKLIRSGYTVHLTQDALARQSGFSSRTVFITAFKKYTGVVPSFFIANYRKMEEAG